MKNAPSKTDANREAGCARAAGSGADVEVHIRDSDKMPPELQRAMHESVAACVEAVFRIQADNCANMVANPDGEFPMCKPALGTRICERCGRDIKERNGKACPSIPPEKRWSFKERP